MNACVCVHVHVHVHVRVCVSRSTKYMWMHVCMRVCPCVCVCVHVHVRVCISRSTCRCKCMCVCVHVHVRACLYAWCKYLCVCVHVHVRACLYACLYTHVVRSVIEVFDASSIICRVALRIFGNGRSTEHLYCVPLTGALTHFYSTGRTQLIQTHFIRKRLQFQVSNMWWKLPIQYELDHPWIEQMC